MTIKAPQKINTAADLLMNLLQDVKEISLADAAKTLGVPAVTLENWANFLEEEHMLQVKYKFTTPYLVLIPQQEKKQSVGNFERRLPPEEVNEDIKRIEESIGKMDSEIKRGDFSVIREVMASLFVAIRTLKESIHLEPFQKNAFEKKLIEIESMIEKANSYSESGRFDLANRIYLEAKEEVKSVSGIMKQAYVDSKKEPEKPGDAKQLLDNAYSLLKEGKIDESRAAYEKLKDMFNGLPNDYAERHSEMEKNLIKLNKDLSITMDRHSVSVMKEGVRKISGLIKSSKEAANKNDLAKAEEIYYEIKKSFESLPEGFIKERRELEKQILGLFEAISIRRKELISKTINSKITQVKAIVKQIGDEIKAGRIDEPIKSYSKAKKIFEEIPAEFVNERLYIHQLLMPVYQSLYQLYSDKSYNEVKEKTGSIKKLIDAMKAQADAGNAKAAEDCYSEVKALFVKMPAGFMSEKIDLQNAIIEAYEYMLSKSETQSHKNLLESSVDLQKMLSEGFGYIKSGKIELAEAVYSHVVKAYNNLPQGFVYEKASLRQKILNLYREIMLNSDVKILKATKNDVNDKYKEILSLLIDAKHSMETRHFELLEPEYHKIRKIFNELPVGFIQEKLKLRESVIALAEEVDFFRKIVLAEKASLEMNPELKVLIEELLRLKEKVDKPDNKQLIDFFEQKKKLFENALSKIGKEEPKAKDDAFDELHEKISRLRACASPSVRMPET